MWFDLAMPMIGPIIRYWQILLLITNDWPLNICYILFTHKSLAKWVPNLPGIIEYYTKLEYFLAELNGSHDRSFPQQNTLPLIQIV